MPEESRAVPGSQRHSATRAERAEQAAQQQAFEDYAQSPAAGEITRLSQEVTQLREWKNALEGRGGIVVTGTIIELRSNSNRSALGSGSSLGPIVLTLSKNGIPTDYNVNAEEV